MAVRLPGDGCYAVESESGATYVIDLHGGDCSCPDSQARGVLCKHARRVAIESNQGHIPSPGRPVHCQVCGQTAVVDIMENSPRLCADCRLEPGDLVYDRERSRDTPLLVTSVTGHRADEVELLDAGCTVSEYRENRTYSPSDPVVEVVYPRSVRTDRPPRRYSFPISRLAKPDDRCEQTTLIASMGQ